MAYTQEPGVTGTTAGGGQYDNLDTVDSLQYDNIAATKAAEAAASAITSANSASSSSTSADESSVSAAAALVSEGNASISEGLASTSAAAAAQSVIDAANASRLTAGTTTTGNPGSNAAVAITGAAGSQVLDLTIPRGDVGATGNTGTAATIAVGTTTTGSAGSNATVANSGTSAAAVFNFSVPQGDTGAAATIATGTTTTLSPGTSATVSNSGTTGAAVFNFGIPQGNTGATGLTGTAATIAVGTTSTGSPGTSATVTNTGTSAAAVFDFSIPSGAGVITGGTTGQFLAKSSNTDYDTQWLSITGALSYLGSWNASTNTPTVTSSSGTNGEYYVVSVSGSTSIDGITDWVIGDWIIFNGSAWQKIDQTNLVTSVAGRTGAITLSSTDIANFELQQLDDVSITTIADGQVLTYESASSLWKNTSIDGIPTQTGNAGKYLTTNGTAASWAVIQDPIDSAIAMAIALG